MPELYNTAWQILEKARKGVGLSASDLASASGARDALDLRARIEHLADDDFILLEKAAHAARLESSRLLAISRGHYAPPAMTIDAVSVLTLHPKHREHCYILGDPNGEAIVIDPGTDATEILSHLRDRNLTIKAIALTHAHPDHCGAALELARESGCPIFGSPSELALLNATSERVVPVAAGDTCAAGSRILRAVPTPGHTDGGITWVLSSGRAAFVGDILFAGSVGNRFGEASYELQLETIATKILRLGANTALLPGHGPATSVAYERAHNPFFPALHSSSASSGSAPSSSSSSPGT